MAVPTCDRCGSNDLRRKRARGSWRRLYGAVSRRHRYACNACHHRGWTRGVLPGWVPPSGQGHPTPPPGRSLEHRDLVAERQARLDRLVGVVIAVSLGALLALFIGWAVHQ